MPRTQVMSSHRTAREVVKGAGMNIQKEDEIIEESSLDILANGVGRVLMIKRSTPVRLLLYGEESQVYSKSRNVRDFLAEKNIALASDDTLSLDQNSELSPNMTIEIWRNGVQTISEKRPVDFNVERIQDPNQATDYRQVQKAGVKGEKMVTFEVNMKNGQEISRREIQSVVTKQPETEVVVVGAKPSFGGDFAAALSKLRACEAGGSYSNKNNPSYRGAYQFDYRTWANRGGYYDPADAPPEVQDQAARELYVRRGWQPWPVCGSSIPDVYR